MPDDDPLATRTEPPSSQHAAPAPEPPRAATRSLFAIPPPLKRVFDQFPLVTYAANGLPLRAPRRRGEHVLHVFTTGGDASRGRPSFNPACLKWQAYLKFNGLDFRTVPSNNHASPSGALPFLLPATVDRESGHTPDPVPSNRLRKWMGSQKTGERAQESADVRYEAYASLLDHRIRKAWLLQLYLAPANSPLLHRLYIDPCSSNLFVRMAIAHQLRRAAQAELVKASASGLVVEADIARDAREAFEALSLLLGDDEWFFGAQQPALFDASVFAYSQLLLDDSLSWGQNPLAAMLGAHPNLVRHRERIATLYF